MRDEYDVIIIGGGAAGLMAARQLGRQGRRVALLEKQDRVGRKLLSTGNGRCNLTHIPARAEDYHGSRQAAAAALRRFSPKSVTALFGEMGICCVQDEAGRVYPMSRQAASVLDALRLGCDEAGVDTRTGFAVTALLRLPGGFEARSAGGEKVRGRCALVCTGGLAAPKLGACGDGYRLLEALGHRVSRPFPAIVPLKTRPEAVRGLKGVRAEAELTLTAGGKALRRERGEVLFAEDGVSGIAAMQMGRLAGERAGRGEECALRLNFVPDMDAVQLLQARARALPLRRAEDFLNGIVPRRLGQVLAKEAGIPMGMAAGEMTGPMIRSLGDRLGGWTLPILGTRGFDQAQASAGGASLKDFDLRRMASLRAPGLFAAGEVLDVDGDCGGFNLQWAWSSALMAAEGIEQMLKEGDLE